METFLTAVVLVATVALGVFLIHRLNNQHDERIADFPYGRSRPTVRGPAPSAPHRLRGWLRPRLRPRRRTRTAGK